MEDEGEEGAFALEQCKAIVEKQVASQIVPDLVWNPKLENMQTLIIENILKELNAENEARQGPQGPLRFKFVVLCELQQNSGAGLANACTCYWDNATDGHYAYKYATEYIQAFVTVYGVLV